MEVENKIDVYSMHSDSFVVLITNCKVFHQIADLPRSVNPTKAFKLTEHPES